MHESHKAFSENMFHRLWKLNCTCFGPQLHCEINAVHTQALSFSHVTILERCSPVPGSIVTVRLRYVLHDSWVVHL